MSQLNVLEIFWQNIFDNYDHFWALSVLGFTVHRLPILCITLVYAMCHFAPFLHKYKLQKGVSASRDDLIKCFKGLFWVEVLVNIPSHLLFYPAARLTHLQITQVPFPTMSTVLLQFMFFLFADDAWLFWTHWLMHRPALYKRFHKIHHEYKSPFSLAAEYAHPLDHALVNVGGIFVAPCIYVSLVNSDLHVVSIMFYIIVKSLIGVEHHCGYDFPWSLRRWIPFYAGSEFHDYHHEKFEGNYGSTMRIWDWIMGSSLKFYQWKQDKIAAKELQTDYKQE